MPAGVAVGDGDGAVGAVGAIGADGVWATALIAVKKMLVMASGNARRVREGMKNFG